MEGTSFLAPASLLSKRCAVDDPAIISYLNAEAVTTVEQGV